MPVERVVILSAYLGLKRLSQCDVGVTKTVAAERRAQKCHM